MDTVFEAIASHKADAVRQILEKSPKQVNATNELGESPLHRAAWEGLPDILRMLLDAGADPISTTPNGDTPLHFAAHEDRPGESAETLIGGGAEIDARNRADQTPLFIACMRGNQEVARILVDRGAQVDLACAILMEEDQRVRLLLQKDPNLRTLVQPHLVIDLLIRRGKKEMLQLLLQHGVDPNAGRPPILTAIEMCLNDPSYDPDIIPLLLGRANVPHPSVLQTQLKQLAKRFPDERRLRVASILRPYGLTL